MSTPTDAIAGVANTSANYASNAANQAITKKALGQDEFLKLLVAQLSAQDPLNPQKDTDYIAQLAQFSSLEQTKSMQTDLASLKSYGQLTQAQSLLGQTVQLKTGDTTAVTGTVQAVQIVDGMPKLSVNGLLYDLGQVTAVAQPSPTTTTTATANLK
jgi:flagellar basal-body rod modification protein FlgD